MPQNSKKPQKEKAKKKTSPTFSPSMQKIAQVFIENWRIAREEKWKKYTLEEVMDCGLELETKEEEELDRLIDEGASKKAIARQSKLADEAEDAREEEFWRLTEKGVSEREINKRLKIIPEEIFNRRPGER